MTASQFNIWEGIYGSFQAADADAIGPGFHGQILRERALVVARDCLASFKAGRMIPQLHKQRSTMLPPVAAMLLDRKRPLRVLDYGGGFGIGYLTMAEGMPQYRDDIEYTIVELPDVCEEGRKLHSGLVKYIDKLPENAEFDLVHSSSVLQYFQDWGATLSMLASLRPKYILLSDVFAGEIPTFVTLQNNYGSKIKHWFLNFDEFHDRIRSTGYRLLVRAPVSARRLGVDNILPMDNFPSTHRLEQTLHVLIGRNSQV